MKRRSFLQAVGGAIAVLFVPAVAAKKSFQGSVSWIEDGIGGIAVTETCGDLSEAALEDIIIEINEFQSATGQRIFVSAPTKLLPI